MVNEEDITKLEVLAARTSLDGDEPIRIHQYHEKGELEYVDVTFRGDRKNLQLHYERFRAGECPYNQLPQTTPYIVIKGDVYEISTFTSIGYREEDIG